MIVTYLAKIAGEGYGVGTKNFSYNQMDEPVEEFLARVSVGQGILVEDETGRGRSGVVESIEVSPVEQKQAWAEIQQLQQKTKQAIEEQGDTVDEVERLILADED